MPPPRPRPQSPGPPQSGAIAAAALKSRARALRAPPAAARPPPLRSLRRPAARPPARRAVAPVAPVRRRSRQMLLQSLDGVVKMHSRGPGRGPERRRDLLVFEPLLRPQQEYLALHPGQPPQALRQARFHLSRYRVLVRIAVRVSQLIRERDHASSFDPPVCILQHVPADRHQPGAKPTLPAEPSERPERANECFLYQIIDVCVAPRAAGTKESSERPRVTADQLGRRLLVAGLPGGNQRRIRRDRGDGFSGGHARRDGRRESWDEIKTAGRQRRHEVLLPPLLPCRRAAVPPLRFR